MPVLFGIDRQFITGEYNVALSNKIRQYWLSKWFYKSEDKYHELAPKKMYYLLSKDLKTLKIGRDKFIDILRANHLLIVPKRSNHITINLHHRFRKY